MRARLLTPRRYSMSTPLPTHFHCLACRQIFPFLRGNSNDSTVRDKLLHLVFSVCKG